VHKCTLTFEAYVSGRSDVPDPRKESCGCGMGALRGGRLLQSGHCFARFGISIFTVFGKSSDSTVIVKLPSVKNSLEFPTAAITFWAAAPKV
jgi:hypothetical protein